MGYLEEICPICNEGLYVIKPTNQDVYTCVKCGTAFLSKEKRDFYKNDPMVQEYYAQKEKEK